MRCDVVLVEELQQREARYGALAGQQQGGAAERLRQGPCQAKPGPGIEGEPGFDQQPALQFVAELRGGRPVGDEGVEPPEHEFAQ